MNEELLIRFLAKSCTREEFIEVERWISADPAKANWLFEMEHIWSLKDELRYSDQPDAYYRFVRATMKANRKQKKKRQLSRGWMRYAAAVVIVSLLLGGIYQVFRSESPEPSAFNTIEVPIGQHVAITLAEGTKIWLNSGSILSYPQKFDQKNRTVRLDGEGYFEVESDEKRPFIVSTSMLEVEVLGTKFNVNAYSNEDTRVSLVEGKLHIQADKQSTFMAPNDLATYSKQSGLVLHQNKEVKHVMKWISGELIFIDERLENITNTLERHFGVTITIHSPALSDERFSCRTQQGVTLEQVLNLLKGTRKINYSIKGNKVYISQ